MTPPGRRWRALAPDAAASVPLVTLDPDESHHLSRVLRARPGDPVDVFDGRGREWSGVFEGGGAVRLHDELSHPVEPPSRSRFSRRARARSGSSGCSRRGPRSASSPSADRDRAGGGRPPSPARLERWRRILIEAAKQSGRRVVPAFDVEPSWPRSPAANAALVLHPGSAPIAAALGAPRPASVEIAVGPEGGFDDEEIAALPALGWTPAGLGPRILRTETAGPLAAAIVLHAWGDLGAQSRPVDSGDPAPRFRFGLPGKTWFFPGAGPCTSTTC